MSPMGDMFTAVFLNDNNMVGCDEFIRIVRISLADISIDKSMESTAITGEMLAPPGRRAEGQVKRVDYA